MCLGHIVAIMAAVDLRLAVHRRQTYGTGRRLLHTIHTNESIYYIRYGYCCVLRTGDCDVRIILENMEGD